MIEPRNPIDEQLEKLFRAMQTPAHAAGANWLFEAMPEEIGRAAARAAAQERAEMDRYADRRIPQQYAAKTA